MCYASEKCGYVSGYRLDENEPEWPVISIHLPDIGEVSWHIPKGELAIDFETSVTYDGHTNEEKEERILKYIRENNDNNE